MRATLLSARRYALKSDKITTSYELTFQKMDIKMILKNIVPMATKLFTSVLCIGLFSCSNLPSEVVISPTIFSTNVHNYQNSPATLQVEDRRNNVHILQIIEEEKATALINSQAPLKQIVTEQLSTHYKTASLKLINDPTLSSALPVNIHVFIDTALISVKQELFDYSSTNLIEVQVKMLKGNVTLTKTFKQKGATKGPMKADFAVLERDFSQQLSNVIQNILSDKELQEFIR